METSAVKTGWLKDNDGEHFAPKTLISQVQASDGTLLNDILDDLRETSSTAEIELKGTIANNCLKISIK